MFEKKEDKLFGYAFGDLDEQDAQVFEASLLKDEASAEEVKFLQSIKGDLESFRDIPEMQYSKERLRSAILGQGLKPTRPGFPWLNWVLAPGAATCVVALGYVLMYGTSRKDPTLIGVPNMASNSSVGIKLPEQKLTKPEPIVAEKDAKGTPTGFPDVRDSHWASDDSVGTFRVSEKRDRVTKSSDRRSRTKAPLLAMREVKKSAVEMASESVKTSVSLTGGSGGGGAMSPGAAGVVSDSVMMKSEPTPSVDATIILIDKDQDSGVGAPTAIEVNDTKNVIIGG
jgi:anti-sigma factor RsiW